MASIIIDTDWLKPARANPLPGRLFRWLRAYARLQRRAHHQRRTLRLVRAETLDPRLVEDAGVVVPRHSGNDCIGWLARAQGGNL